MTESGRRRSGQPILIAAVSIDDAGQLSVLPQLGPSENYAFIYRAAMGVKWDPALHSLVAPTPKEWSYLDWFKQIIAAVDDEYGQHLVLSYDTLWHNVPDDLRTEIEAIAGQPDK